MGESTKAVCAALLIGAFVAAALAWSTDRPNDVVWGFRIGGPIVAGFALALLLKLQFRTDIAEDYLRRYTGKYFNRDGFCFAFSASCIDGVGYIDAYFQSQYDAPCVGQIALRPARRFFLGRARIEAITYEIDCAPAAFGVARVAVPIPEKLQGKRVSFEVGASVDYPNGKGPRLRFRDGTFLRTNSRFGDAFGTGLSIAGIVAGGIYLVEPAKAVLNLPIGVAEDVPGESTPEIVTLWKLGDPPLEGVQWPCG